MTKNRKLRLSCTIYDSSDPYLWEFMREVPEARRPERLRFIAEMGARALAGKPVVLDPMDSRPAFEAPVGRGHENRVVGGDLGGPETASTRPRSGDAIPELTEDFLSDLANLDKRWG